MKYLDNLIAWGDQLFRQDTMETINEATQLYVLAANILGERPPIIPQRGVVELKSFDELKDDLDAFSNALVALENELPAPDEAKAVARPDAPAPAAALGPTLYFCIPRNDKLLGYWDTVADRLFKIRHCLNIEGVERAAGALRAADRPRDARPRDGRRREHRRRAQCGFDRRSARLPIRRARRSCPRIVCRAEEPWRPASQRPREARRRGAGCPSRELGGRAVAGGPRRPQAPDQGRRDRRPGPRTDEGSRPGPRDLLRDPPVHEPAGERAHRRAEHRPYPQSIAQGMDVLAAGLAVIPIFDIGVSGAFSSPVAKVKIGGRDFANAVGFAKQALAMGSSIATFKATMASIMAGFDRRQDDWQYQADQARKEQKLIDKQIVGADLRRQIAEQELTNHELQIEQSQAIEAVLRDKYTNVELYDYMIGQLSQVFFQTYQLAYDTAKVAERALQHELGDPNATFVDFGYWDSLRKGLLAGERMSYDLQRMERSYVDLNKREYELTKHVSLAVTDPSALMRLRTTGECFVELPEALFDSRPPGPVPAPDKTVSVTIPCVAGPYTSINCTLTLLRNSVRTSSDPRARVRPDRR